MRACGRLHEPLPPDFAERLARVLERRATSHPDQRMPADPLEAAAFNRTRLAAQQAAEQTVAFQRDILRHTERLLLRQQAALRTAERRAAALDVPPPLAQAPEAGHPATQIAPSDELVGHPDLPGWLREWQASGPALAAARRRYGLTQRQLAREAHYARSYVADLERATIRATRSGTSPGFLAARRRLAIVVARHIPLVAPEGAPV